MGEHEADPIPAPGPGRFIADPAVRRWIYSVAAASITVLKIYGLIDEEQAKAWADWLMAVVGLGALALAIPNTPKTQGEPPRD